VSGSARSVALIVFWLAVSFLVAGLTFLVSGVSPIAVLSGSIEGAVTGPEALTASVRWAVPLVVIGLGALVSFRAGYFNIGALGQMYVGAIASTVVGLNLDGGPAALVVPLAMAAAIGAGAAWSVVPGYLRLRFGANEILTTLMMSFIATLLLQYLTRAPMRNAAGAGAVASTERLVDEFRISGGSGVSFTIVAIALAAVAATWVLLARTRFGFTVRLLGRNPEMMRWQGASSFRVGLATFAIAGATAGLAGALEVFGPSGRLTAGFSSTIGFEAIVIVLVGSMTVVGVVLVGLLFGGLRAAALHLPISGNVPRSAIDTLNGLIALLITARVMPTMLGRRRRQVPSTSARPAVVDHVSAERGPTDLDPADLSRGGAASSRVTAIGG
jgi:simple sugar transport system permease protein